MRVLIINTSERIGGAAIAANRLMEALKKNGVKAKMLVRDKQSRELTVSSVPSSLLLPIKFLWERFVIFMANGLRKRNIFQVDIANTGTDITKMFEFEQADVIHLHWVNQGFLSMKNLKSIFASGKPIVVTMHDMWYFTGICHYAGDCRKYESQCEKCPLLTNGGIGRDLARRVFEQKKAILQNHKVAFIGCSKWISDLASDSQLTKGQLVMNIPNAINTSVFHPISQKEARENQHLPQDKLLLLFGSQRITDERKGFRFLAEACHIINKENPELAKKIGVVVLGSESEKVKSQIPFDLYAVDYLSDENDIMQLYNSASLYVTTSLQDNLPNTIVEAMACGTPCVGFEVGGIPEMIDHQKNGYVAKYKDAADFAKGIQWCLNNQNYASLCEKAHEKAITTYSEDRIARRYTEIYNLMMQS